MNGHFRLHEKRVLGERQLRFGETRRLVIHRNFKHEDWRYRSLWLIGSIQRAVSLAEAVKSEIRGR